MATVAIIQARMGSTRLPGKVLKSVLGKPMLWHIVNRVRKAEGVDEVVVATSDLSADEQIRQFCSENGIPFFGGSETDVLDRFYRAAKEHNADPVLRITGDCPFADPVIIGKLIRMYREGNHDHIGVATGAGALYLEQGRFPDGLDAECFSFASLEKAWKEATHGSDREHVTPYIWRNKDIFRTGFLMCDCGDYSHFRWTVDNDADFALVTKIYETLYSDNHVFLMDDVITLLKERPDLSEMNSDFIGKEEYEKVWQAGKTEK
ncbi:glycosyltransferase family protein [Geobacter pelophilus]|uniref:Glycosyltransferase family protein n=1 Tax=Geoanaerobacter pelophilus TaxID=60036 RepID=A0AAW4KZV4_9BACT|nr:glycosyltransferase family protein [Geoanaerobacter pelophilus]MBT0663929.1 glycosyltransferase family protein [Geoanaerobacter pelophilus]